MAFKNLDLDTLRTLAVANDLGGYSQAASRLGRTPSAVSLQMKRLQEDIGSPLQEARERPGLDRGWRADAALRTADARAQRRAPGQDAGASLTDHVRVGVLTGFRRPRAAHGAVALRPSLSTRRPRSPNRGNGALIEAVSTGQIDVALVVGHDDRPTAQVLGQLELGWIAGRDFSLDRNHPLPLILLGPQCAFRKDAIKQLDAAGIAWRVAATSPSLAGLWASALGGLGLTLRSRLSVPDSLIWHRRLFNLPEPSSFPVTLHAQPHATSPSLDRLRAIIGEVVSESLPAALPAVKRKQLARA